MDGRGGDDLGRGHGGHALEGFVFHGLVLLTAVTRGSALTQMEGGMVCVCVCVWWWGEAEFAGVRGSIRWQGGDG